MRFITSESIISYNCYLVEEEKSAATIEKYVHDVTVFKEWLGNIEIIKGTILDYKHHLMDKYAELIYSGCQLKMLAATYKA